MAKVSKEVDKQVKGLELELKQVTRGHSILNENQVQKLFNSTPQRWTYKRPAKGGGEWRYVRRGYVRRTLDSVFGFDWSFEPETPVGEAFEVAKLTGSVIVKGKITARVQDTRGNLIATLVKGDYGRAEVKFKKGTKDPLDFGNDMKAATTDCFKRCAMWFGIAADVYDPEEFMQINIIGADEQSERTENTKKLIDKAKKELNKPGKAVNDGAKNT